MKIPAFDGSDWSLNVIFATKAAVFTLSKNGLQIDQLTRRLLLLGVSFCVDTTFSFSLTSRTKVQKFIIAPQQQIS